MEVFAKSRRLNFSLAGPACPSPPFAWQDAALDLGVSYGTYTFAGGEGVDEALSAADRAMYAHKQGAE